ncbi:hypothetical protein [Nocardia gipuzkoensis]
MCTTCRAVAWPHVPGVDEVRLAYRSHEAEPTVPLPVPERLHDT